MHARSRTRCRRVAPVVAQGPAEPWQVPGTERLLAHPGMVRVKDCIFLEGRLRRIVDMRTPGFGPTSEKLLVLEGNEVWHMRAPHNVFRPT